MKVVYWNVRNGIADRPVKQKKLFQYAEGADVIILAEAERPGYSGRNYDSFEARGYERFDWIGKYEQKGLIAFAKPGVVDSQKVVGNDRYYSIVLPIVNSDIAIVGVWSKTQPDLEFEKTNNYCRNMENCLKEVVEHLGNPVVLGDFNMSPSASGQKTRAVQVFKEFESFGLQSFYHKKAGEKYGEESCCSYWDGNGGFLLDHVFAKEGTVKMATWPFDEKKYWTEELDTKHCSDHLPIMVEV